MHPDHGLDADRVVMPYEADGARSYKELYIEYTPAARRLASSLVPSDVADDIVAEAFARLLAAIRSGGGPSQTFPWVPAFRGSQRGLRLAADQAPPDGRQQHGRGGRRSSFRRWLH
jgi:hypothetical protein